MPTGDTLATLVQEVQYELSQVVTPAAGQNFREHIKNRIRREYRRLYHDHNWRHLRKWTDVPLSAGQRYYNYPAGVTVETVIEIYVQWGIEWLPITDSLIPEMYNGMNSDLGQRSDPVQRWRPYSDTQLEVWPLPAAASSHLRFVHKAPFAALVDESDRCALDTDLVVLFAASRLAGRSDEKEAARLDADARSHYATIKARSHAATKANLAGGGEASPRDPRNRTIVGVESRQG